MEEEPYFCMLVSANRANCLPITQLNVITSHQCVIWTLLHIKVETIKFSKLSSKVFKSKNSIYQIPLYFLKSIVEWQNRTRMKNTMLNWSQFLLCLILLSGYEIFQVFHEIFTALFSSIKGTMNPTEHAVALY